MTADLGFNKGFSVVYASGTHPATQLPISKDLIFLPVEVGVARESLKLIQALQN